MSLMYRYQQGFTLVELLVVIAIIGIIANITLSNLSDARTQAQYAVVEQDMRQIIGAFEVAHTYDGRVMLHITDHTCTMCACRNYSQNSGLPIWTVRDDPPPGDTSLATRCIENWRNALERINELSPGVALNADGLLYDPWGSPYLLDENELEFDHNRCRRDSIRSAGRDGIYDTSDDYIIYLPFRSAECS